MCIIGKEEEGSCYAKERDCITGGSDLTDHTLV